MFVIDSSARCGENRTGRAESVVRVRRAPRCERRSRRVLHTVPSRARRYHRIGVSRNVRGNVFNPFQQSASFHRGAPRTSRHRRARFYSNFLTFASKKREADGRVNAKRRDPRHRERARACRHFTTARIDRTNTSQAEVRCHSPSHASLRALRRVESIARSALFIASKNASGRTRASRLIGHDATTSRRGLNRP